MLMYDKVLFTQFEGYILKFQSAMASVNRNSEN